jgi:hypothetical protein
VERLSICPASPAKSGKSIPLAENRSERKTGTHKGVIVSISQNVETAKKGYDAYAAGDVETALSEFDDDIEWSVPGNSTISGTYRGKSKFWKC